MSEHDGQLLAKTMREQRNKLNLTQEKLSEFTNISLTKIIQYENGNNADMPFYEISILSNFFGVTINYLITGEESKFDDSELAKMLNKPSRPCSCGNSNLVVDADETGFHFIFCPNCQKQGLRGKDIEEAIKMWNKGKVSIKKELF